MAQFSHTHRVPKSACPYCGHNMDAASGGKDGPQEEDCSVCIRCGNWLVYGPGLILREMSAKEIEELPADTFRLLSTISRARAEVYKEK